MTWEQVPKDNGVEMHKNEAIDRKVCVYKRPEGRWMFIAQSISPGKYIDGEIHFSRRDARGAMRERIEMYNQLK